MRVEQVKIQRIVKEKLVEGFPELQSEIEPRVENKIEIREKEVEVIRPVTQLPVVAPVPKVKLYRVCIVFNGTK